MRKSALRLSAALAVLLVGVSPVFAAAARPSDKLLAVDHASLPTAAKIQDWLDQRDQAGPAYTGGPAWKKFMALIESELTALGAADIVHNPFPYTRWYTTEFPDKSGWSLTSDGKPVDVAAYGTQSGSTGPNGVTAPMVLYDLNLPVETRPALTALAGKIVVVKQQPFSTFATPARVPLGVSAPQNPFAYCGNPPACKPPVAGEDAPSPQWRDPGPQMSYRDYEYRSDEDQFPTPLFEKIPVNFESSFRNRDQFGQSRDIITNVLMPSGAAAAVTVMDMSPLASAGTRIHATPRQSNVPLLMLDRVAGEKVLSDAASGKTAKLVLDAHQEENATAYEIVATLPGRDYGTAKDQAILLATHVDGPSIVEDNGALGILAVLNYYAKIPRAERPKSIVVYFESRHFVPGTEPSYPLDITEALPERFKNVVGGLALEHFGGLQFAETGNTYASTGRAATTFFWGWPNRLAIAEATKAIKDQAVPRAINDVPARPGIHGMPQAAWLGGGFSHYLVELGGWPGWHISGDWPSAGFQAYYPSGKDRVNADIFLKQASAAVQLSNVLMTKDAVALAPAWGYLETSIATMDDKEFVTPNARGLLKEDFEAVFSLVRQGRYADIEGTLAQMKEHASRVLSPKGAEIVKASIEDAAKFAAIGVEWKSKGLIP